MYNMIIFGPPGSGKGTQSANIVEKYKLKHLSTGDLLRAEKNSGSELGQQIAELINGGNLVPDEMIQDMIKPFITNRKYENGFILDGFPRTTNQAQWLKELIESDGAKINILLSLFVEDDVLEERLLGRGKDSGRVDDQELATVQNRIQVYHKTTQPVMEFYKKQGKFRHVDGIGKVEDIFERICKVIEE